MPSRTGRKVEKPLAGMSACKVAEKSNIPVGLLYALARNTSVVYKPTRYQKKPGGGRREIDAPRKKYKRLLKKIARSLASSIEHHPAAHGGVPGKSSFTSARPHCGAKYVVTRDVKECYPSVNTDSLRSAFRKLGASVEFANFLASLATVHNRIPQGGPLSCIALNLYFWGLDEHFDQQAKLGLSKYGRLTDDFVASSNSKKRARSLEKALDHAIRDKGLAVNERKARLRGFMNPGVRKEIHGLLVSSKRGLKPKKEHVQKGLGLAKKYVRWAKCGIPRDLAYLADLRARAAGMMYYLRQADSSPARHIRTMLEAGDKRMLRMLKKKGLDPYKNKWWVVHRTRNEPLRLLRLWEGRQKYRITASKAHKKSVADLPK